MGKVRYDLQTGFWNEYREPRTKVAALLQKPAAVINAESLASAYMADFRASRRMEKSNASPTGGDHDGNT